jgi:hypothetical protein
MMYLVPNYKEKIVCRWSLQQHMVYHVHAVVSVNWF